MLKYESSYVRFATVYELFFLMPVYIFCSFLASSIDEPVLY